ncbi:MAG: heme ABC exporter ATP-binding protein CcmA [Caldilineales bacterium]|nr:heme ABC exporter ATP-binding protein CcmA [Caldilineales bacterium]MDW8316640.1 heme ABC exporter ATP-binding protein CcmA [Anaerolineae bacterium]
MITVERLTKAFGRTVVLRDVSLHVPAGETLVLFGPNGAGKTTLVRIIAGLSRPTAGSVTLGGVDVRRAGEGLRRYVGVVSHNPLVYESLTGEENLRFFGRLYEVPNLAARVDEVLDQVGLRPRRRDLVRTYSRGMVQRLAIARAILHDPPILLLDEPDTGLDQQAADMLRRLLVDLGSDRRAVLFTTHNLDRGIEWADRVAILSGGRLRFEAPTAGLSPAQMREAYAEAVAAANRKA